MLKSGLCNAQATVRLLKNAVLVHRGAIRAASAIAEEASLSDDARKRYVPRRAVLYVPGNEERMLKKIPQFDVDCAILDCEDGVAINRKVRISSRRHFFIDIVTVGKLSGKRKRNKK